MATLWPRKLPRSVIDDPRRHAEVRVYNKLSEVLDDSFHVFYSSPWLGTDTLGNEKDGECDFLVAHAEHGLLAIEVKGGGISYDSKDNQWKSTDAHGFVHKIKDPINQAKSAKYEILSRLKLSSMWKSRRIHAAHGVIFPSAAAPSNHLGPDRPAEIFCCFPEFQKGLGKWIKNRLKAGNRPTNCLALSANGILALEKLLASPFTLNYRIGAALSEADEEFRILEPSQYHVLDCILDIPRALISGGAGTGKTVVAIEEAIRSSTKGQKTLLICHSKPLAANLERRLDRIENLTVAGFHYLCGSMASKTGLKLPVEKSPKDLFENILPNALCQAMEIDPSLKWDMIIVDEGQDFIQNWWIAIDFCLNDKGRIRVFMDSNQKVYDQAGSGVHDLTVTPIRLTRNLRNTKNIHNVASIHYSGPDIVADGPLGLEVLWTEASNTEAKIQAAFKELRRLVFNEDVPPSDIAILFNCKIAKEQFIEKATGTSIPITDAVNMELENVVVDTTRRFKGLERPAVIFVNAGVDMQRRELAYVAFSRARAFLNVIASKEEMIWLRSDIA